MKKVINKINGKSLEAYVFIRSLLTDKRGVFGRDEITGIAIGLILVAFIVLPQLRNFVTTVMTGMSNWWGNTISPEIFPTS